MDIEGQDPAIIKGSYAGRDYFYNISSFHSTIYQVSIHLKDTVIKLMLNEADLRKDYSLTDEIGKLRQCFENANYDWNAYTALWKFIQLMQKQIDQLEKKKRFIYKRLSP